MDCSKKRKSIPQSIRKWSDPDCCLLKGCLTHHCCHLLPFFHHPRPSDAFKYSGRWVRKMWNRVAQQRRDPGSIHSCIISCHLGWRKGELTQFRENPAKPQIALLRLGLRPIGKGALVVTGGPRGDGADGRSRRAEVGLCIMWLAAAVTVSLLSPLIPAIPVICGQDFSPHFSFPERLRSSGNGRIGIEWNVILSPFCFYSFPPHPTTPKSWVHLFSVAFKIGAGFDFRNS